MTHATTGADERESDTALHTTKTFCRICPAFCGLEVTTDGDKILRIEPDQDNPYSWKDFCSKAANAKNIRDHAKRITTPMKRVGDTYVAATYEEAIADIAARLNAIRAKHGPDAIATYLGNPGASNSPAAMFMGGFMAGLGSKSRYSVGSIDQNNLHVVGELMYGCAMTILNPDVDNARCFLFLGMNPAVSTMSWLDTAPNGWKRILAAQKNGADLIIVDPRATPSTKKANTHVQIIPGEDWAFLLGIIKVAFREGWTHQADCAEANGVETIEAIANGTSLDYLSKRCGVAVVQIEDIARRFATAETAVCVARTGVSQHRNGTLGEWLSHVLNLVTGRTDRKGGRYYQPGLLKNTMAAYNRVAPKALPPSRVHGYRAVAGAYPLSSLADEITTPGDGQVRAFIINSGNPVNSGPDGDRLDSALAQLDLLVAVDFFQRESHRHAHWLIPGCHFLEREELLANLSILFERPFIQYGQAAIAPRDGVWPEWRFFLELALAMDIPFMGNPLMDKQGLNAMARSGTPLSPRFFWESAVRAEGVVPWEEVEKSTGGWLYQERTYGHLRPALQTQDGRIQAAPEELVDVLKNRLAEKLPAPDTHFPYKLVNQRRLSMMNSWLVETNHHSKVYGNYIDINPLDAARQGIAEGQQVRVTSKTGAIEVEARLTDEVPTGILSMDHGWGSRLFDPTGKTPPEVQGVNRNVLVSAEVLDELSGVPCFNGTAVNIQVV